MFNYSNRSYSYGRDILISLALILLPGYIGFHNKFIIGLLSSVFFLYVSVNIISFLKTRKHIDTYTKVCCICGVGVSILFLISLIWFIANLIMR